MLSKVLEEEQKQMTLAMKESKEEGIQTQPDFAALYGMATPLVGRWLRL
jgi:hypothetical protein